MTSMYQIPSLALLLSAPVYVFLSYLTNAVSPWWQRVTHTESTQPTSVTMTFVGDMMFDRYIREKAEQNGYDAILTHVQHLLAESDLVFGNLEGPITTFASVSDYRDSGPNHYKFTFATTVAETLAIHNVSAVTLGNNHIRNFGTEGVAQTKLWLDQAGIGYAGAPDDAYTPWRHNKNGRDIALYAYDPWQNMDIEALATRIQAEATTTIVIVFSHWGEEYETLPNTAQRTAGHKFVEAGADIVVGSHPHVIQSKEFYQGAWIYYSLGNFVFDQYFSKEVQCGAVLTLTFDTNNSASTSERFIELRQDGTTRESDCRTDVPIL
jgi:gamma-polyglutamate biosynthesis protein CapA